METIEARLKRVVSSVVAVDDDDFKPEASLVENFNADSFDLVEIAMGIEDEFSIRIPPDDMTRLTTIRGVMDYIKSKVK